MQLYLLNFLLILSFHLLYFNLLKTFSSCLIIPLSKHPALFCGYSILLNLFTDFVVVVVIYLFISWRLITLQYCSGFCHTLT